MDQNQDLTPIDFSTLKWITIPVTVCDQKYILREADEAAAQNFRNARMKGMKINQDGKVVGLPENPAGLQKLLVSLCLFTEGEDGKPDKQVHINSLDKWPARVIKTLFERAKRISGLEEKEDTVEELEKKLEEAKKREEAAKNS